MGTVGAAEYLGVTPRTLYRLIDQSLIPAYQIGRVIRLQRDDLEAYLHRVRIEPGALRHLHPETSKDEDRGEPGGDPAATLVDVENVDVSGRQGDTVPGPRMRLAATVLGAEDANALASFYQRLLGWAIAEQEQDWVRLRPPSEAPACAGLSFAHEPGYTAPTWPTEPRAQQMMAHLDIAVDDMEAGVGWAAGCGAVLAEHQPQEHVRVMLDPAGHPFCLFLGPV